MNLSDVEPFTDYSCSGLIKDNGVSINKRLPPVQIRIDCGTWIIAVSQWKEKGLEEQLQDSLLMFSVFQQVWRSTPQKV